MAAHDAAPRRARPGWVYLVGGGPGDPDLLTVRARRLLASCDVVLYDHLISTGVLACVRRRAAREFVGKIGHGPQCGQCDIERRLVAHARAGRAVVRLKGGDPFVFGRGGEEALALAAADVPFEVVPGVSAALAAPAYAGIPVTHRDVAGSVAFVTGHRRRGRAPALAAVARADTVVVLMGLARLAAIAAELRAAGRPAATPAAVVAHATTGAQTTVVATLDTVAAAAARAGVTAPAVLVVGEVVRLRDALAWFAPDRVHTVAKAV